MPSSPYMMDMVVRSLFLLFLTSSLNYLSGSTVAKFSGENVHKRLVSDEAYKQGNFEVALKNAFLGTDEDIRAGEFWSVLFLLGLNSPMSVCLVNDRRISILQGSFWVYGRCCLGHSRGPHYRRTFTFSKYLYDLGLMKFSFLGR